MNRISFNARSMKAINKYTVLNYVRQGDLSRADIARLTSLTRASITNIIDELIAEGLVCEIGAISNKVGKPSKTLAINPDAYFAIGLAITRAEYIISVSDLDVNIIEQTIVDAKKHSLLTSTLSELQTIINGYIEKYDNVLGLGISAPGPIDQSKGFILNPPSLNKWHYFHICDYFQQVLSIPVFLSKDINAYAIMEKTFNKDLKGMNFAEIDANRGIGSSIIINDELFLGTGQGCEFGHMSIDTINGIPCECGNIGCVEKYAAVPTILNKFNQKGYNFKTWEQVSDALYSSDEDRKAKANEIVNEIVLYLGNALVSFLNIYSVNIVVISGKLAYRSLILTTRLENYVNSRILSKSINSVKIIASKISNLESKSSCNLIIDKFFNSEVYNLKKS